MLHAPWVWVYKSTTCEFFRRNDFFVQLVWRKNAFVFASYNVIIMFSPFHVAYMLKPGDGNCGSYYHTAIRHSWESNDKFASILCWSCGEVLFWSKLRTILILFRCYSIRRLLFRYQPVQTAFFDDGNNAAELRILWEGEHRKSPLYWICIFSIWTLNINPLTTYRLNNVGRFHIFYTTYFNNSSVICLMEMIMFHCDSRYASQDALNKDASSRYFFFLHFQWN